MSRITPSFLLAFVFSLLSTIETFAAPVTFATFNIRNYSSSFTKKIPSTDKEMLANILDKTNADIIAVQEIVDGEDFQAFVEEHLPQHRLVLSECGGRGRQKLGFIYRYETYELLSFNEDQRVKRSGESCHTGIRPAAVGIFKQAKSAQIIAAVAVHLKAGGRQANADVRHGQYKALTKIISDLSKQTPLIAVMGDFNTTDYIHKNHNYERYVGFVQENLLKDSAPATECTSYWWGGINDGLMYGSILDHILISDSLNKKYKAQTTEVQSHCQKVACRPDSEDVLGSSFSDVSDHCPVVTSLK